jgi:type VI secretion system protein ImpA
MIPLEKLLKPISDDNPCGEDLFRDGSLLQLESLIRLELDSEEKEIEPDWRQVQQEALKLMDRSKDLRVAVILGLALVRLEGLEGFRDSLRLLHGWVNTFWESLLPLLDPEDPEDPSRINVLNSLSAPLANETPYRFIKYLTQLPLCRPKRLSPCSLRDVRAAQETKDQGQAESRPETTPAQIEARFRDTPVEQLTHTQETLAELLKTVGDLKALVEAKSSGGQSPDFALLEETLAAMQACLGPYLGQAPASGPASVPGAEAPATPAAQAATSFVPGAIHSRAEAEAALRAVSDYLRRHEPSSPVPLLIERTQRLLQMNFIQSMTELAIGSNEDFKRLFGAQSENQEKPAEQG